MTEPGKQDLLALVFSEQALVEQLAAAGGEITPELEAMIDHVQFALTGKVDNYVYAMKRLEDLEARVKQYAEYHRSAARTVAELRDRLKERAKSACEASGGALEGGEWTVKLAKAALRLVIDDEEKLPLEYKREVLTYEIKKDELKADLESGIPVQGAHIEGGTSLRIVATHKGRK